MAKNLSRKYASMSEDDRNRFRVEESEGVKDRPEDLDFEEPPSPYHIAPSSGATS